MLSVEACGSLTATLLYAIVAVIAGLSLAKQESRVDRAVVVWLIFDVLIHATLEGAFVWLSLEGTVESSNATMAVLWKEYGKADRRWLVSDPTIVSLEILTVVGATIFAALLIVAILKKQPQRHFLQITLSVCELYGGWMTFAPELLAGSNNLTTDNALYLWVYLIFFNGIWVVIPVLLLYQSWQSCTASTRQAAKSGTIECDVTAPLATSAGTHPASDDQRTQRPLSTGYNLRKRT